MSKEYLEQDNILFPDFSNDFDKSIPSLGKYGRMRLNYLKTAKPNLFLEYRQNGTLARHLENTEEEATEMLIRMEDKYIEKHPLPIEKHPLPKGDDFMAVVRARYQARDYAEEIVRHNLIYA